MVLDNWVISGDKLVEDEISIVRVIGGGLNGVSPSSVGI